MPAVRHLRAALFLMLAPLVGSACLPDSDSGTDEPVTLICEQGQVYDQGSQSCVPTTGGLSAPASGSYVVSAGASQTCALHPDRLDYHCWNTY